MGFDYSIFRRKIEIMRTFKYNGFEIEVYTDVIIRDVKDYKLVTFLGYTEDVEEEEIKQHIEKFLTSLIIGHRIQDGIENEVFESVPYKVEAVGVEITDEILETFDVKPSIVYRTIYFFKMK